MDDLIRTFPSLLRAAGDAPEVAEAAALAAWRRVAGEQLRGLAVPFRLHRKMLVVAVPDTTWKRQMEAESGQLLFRLNSLLGQAVVTFIEFRVDPRTVETERARTRASAVDIVEQERRALANAGTLREAAAAIRDEGLRKRFLVAAGCYIERAEENK